MKLIAAIAALVVAGCTTVADLRGEEPFIQTSTAKSVQDFTACMVGQWAARSGSVSVLPRPNGSVISLSYVITSSTIVAALVDVGELGSTRSVTVYARDGDKNDKLRREVGACV